MSLDIWLDDGSDDLRDEMWVNITGNLGPMASAAGIYRALWAPGECEPPIHNAFELGRCLYWGLEALTGNPSAFQRLNPPNGWGTYEELVEHVEALLRACQDYPEAEIGVWR